jgi:hypothetical protein
MIILILHDRRATLVLHGRGARLVLQDRGARLFRHDRFLLHDEETDHLLFQVGLVQVVRS